MTTILVIEDEAIVAIDITQRLKRAGYNVPAVGATGEAALRALEELHPDLVLMDVLLKGEKDGIETAREIKNQFEIPVVFLTGQADEATQERVKNTGAYGFILKPIDTASLLPTVELALARHAFEVQLKESEKRIRELTDALPVVVYETDATGRMTFVNATAFDLFGYTKEEIEAAMSIFQLIAPADLKRARAVFRRRMRGEEIGRVEYSGLRKDGSTFPISIRSALMKHDGAVVGQRGVILDFTELKLAGDEIKEHTHTIETLNCIVTEGNRATDVQSFAEAATNLTLELLHFDSGTIHLFDDSTRRARLQYATGIPDVVVEAIRNIPLDDAQYAAFLVELSPLFIDDCQALSLPHLAELGLESLAVVPLYHYDTRIGAMLVGSFKRHTFSQAEKALLVAIGNEVGTVMANLRADEALKESERRIRELTDALPVVVYETDATGRMTLVNALFFDMFGYTKEELEAGMSLFQLIAPADRRRARALFRRSMSGDDVGRVEYIGLRQDGSTLYVSLRAALLRQDAAVVGLRGIIVDITERKRAEVALHGVQEELRTHATMFNAAHDAIMTLDPEGIITYWNRGAERLYGWTTQEAAGQNANALLRTQFPESREVLWPKLMESGLWEGELIHVTRDGVEVTVASSWTLMKDDGGNPSAILEISSDITERKRAEHQLEESERRIRELTDALPEVLFETDANGILTFISAAMFTRYGWLIGEIEGKVNLLDLVAPSDRERARETISERLQGRDTGWAEYALTLKDGSIAPFDVRTTPIVRNGVYEGLRGIAIDITERKRAEADLIRSERRIREITNALPVVVYETDTTGRMAFVNATAFDLFGYAKEEIEAGVSIFQLIAPADRKRARAVFRRRMNGEDIGSVEYTGLRKDKSTFPISIRAVVMILDGVVIGQRGVILDITELSEAQEELRTHATMFNAAHDAIMTLDPEGIITYWNRGAERLYGWTTQEAAGQNANALLRTQFPESREVLWPKLMESGLWEGELIHVTRDGVEVTVASSWTLMKDDGGNPSAILEISSDITERKRAESALAESEAKLRITFATMADGIVIAALDETVTDCNEAILRLTQRSREEIIGKPFEHLLPPEFRSLIPDAHKFLVGAVLVRTETSRGERETIRNDAQLLRKNGERVDIEVNISTIEDASGQPAEFLIVARDVTERKRMEQQLDDTLADLKRSNAELEQFAYIASHDLQEPLRMITSYMQIIEEDYKGKLDADADQYIAFTVEGAKRMQTLIDDLLAYSRVGTRGEPFIPTSMNSVLSKAIANLEVAIEESHAVVTHDQLPTVLGDESQLIQLFQNLLGNAIKFRGDDAPAIHVGVEETKDGWVFSVRDNGIGIDMKYIERIFTIFQRLHARDEYPGTGIGLAVVKKIVERHGGRIWVKSAPESGSTFYFTLPRRGDGRL
jgi:PAS domain S-box-containing protein